MKCKNCGKEAREWKDEGKEQRSFGYKCPCGWNTGWSEVVCPDCSGNGVIELHDPRSNEEWFELCYGCDGDGWVEEEENEEKTLRK